MPKVSLLALVTIKDDAEHEKPIKAFNLDKKKNKIFPQKFDSY